MSTLAPNEVYPIATKDGRLSEEQLAARERIYAAPLHTLNPGDPASFENQEMWWKFERLRAEDPVHYTPEENTDHRAYWSITKWDDIVAADTDPLRFSNEVNTSLALPGSSLAVLRTLPADATPEQIREAEIRGIPSLLSMDAPAHGIHRGAVAEGVSPANLAMFEPLIRERIGKILDELPIGEEFDWVDLVSKDLTATTLATLFGYPQEKRRDLINWSDVATTIPAPGALVETNEEKDRIMQEFFNVFRSMIEERKKEEPKGDFISLMAHSPHMKNFTPMEIQGDAGVLLIGGNDTTRNTLSGS
ncbi:MAG: cytochrome P450, partial [Actinobacteria bacterium]|nr:cytochrome P450 [Actinomycetota bacterium]